MELVGFNFPTTLCRGAGTWTHFTSVSRVVKTGTFAGPSTYVMSYSAATKPKRTLIFPLELFPWHPNFAPIPNFRNPCFVSGKTFREPFFLFQNSFFLTMVPFDSNSSFRNQWCRKNKSERNWNQFYKTFVISQLLFRKFNYLSLQNCTILVIWPLLLSLKLS